MYQCNNNIYIHINFQIATSRFQNWNSNFEIWALKFRIWKFTSWNVNFEFSILRHQRDDFCVLIKLAVRALSGAARSAAARETSDCVRAGCAVCRQLRHAAPAMRLPERAKSPPWALRLGAGVLHRLVFHDDLEQSGCEGDALPLLACRSCRTERRCSYLR